MVAWTALQWWRVKLDAQGAENVNGGVAVLMVVDGDGVKRATCGGVAVLFYARRWRCAAREVAERSREEENGVAMMVALRRRFAQMQVRGGGARSCDGGRKRRREWKKMVVFGLVAAVVQRRCNAGLLLFPASFSGGRRGDGGGSCHGDGRRGEN